MSSQPDFLSVQDLIATLEKRLANSAALPANAPPSTFPDKGKLSTEDVDFLQESIAVMKGFSDDTYAELSLEELNRILTFVNPLRSAMYKRGWRKNLEEVLHRRQTSSASSSSSTSSSSSSSSSSMETESTSPIRAKRKRKPLSRDSYLKAFFSPDLHSSDPFSSEFEMYDDLQQSGAMLVSTKPVEFFGIAMQPSIDSTAKVVQTLQRLPIAIEDDEKVLQKNWDDYFPELVEFLSKDSGKLKYRSNFNKLVGVLNPTPDIVIVSAAANIPDNSGARIGDIVALGQLNVQMNASSKMLAISKAESILQADPTRPHIYAFAASGSSMVFFKIAREAGGILVYESTTQPYKDGMTYARVDALFRLALVDLGYTPWQVKTANDGSVVSVQEAVGQGATATVFSNEKSQFAIKIIHRADTKLNQEYYATEKAVLQSVKSDFIPALFSVGIAEQIGVSKNTSYPVLFISPLARSCDDQRIKNLNVAVEYKMLSHLFDALQTLHAAGWIHGDIRAHNVMYKIDDDDMVVSVLLVDFGFAFKTDVAATLSEWRGNPFYASAAALTQLEEETPSQPRLAAYPRTAADDLEAAIKTIYQVAVGKNEDEESALTYAVGKARLSEVSSSKARPEAKNMAKATEAIRQYWKNVEAKKRWLSEALRIVRQWDQTDVAVYGKLKEIIVQLAESANIHFDSPKRKKQTKP